MGRGVLSPRPSGLTCWRSMVAMLENLVAVAVVMWGLWFAPPPIDVQFHQPTQNIDAQGMGWSATMPDGSCLVSVHPTDFPALPIDYQMAVMLHEVGHCFGLGHFGHCQLEPAVMASCPIPLPTERDRVELIRIRGYRAVLGGLASD